MGKISTAEVLRLRATNAVSRDQSKVSNPITDQEIAFAHLVLSGTMTDRQAAEAAGLNPDSAAYSKPRVRAYLLEHRAGVQQQLVQQEADLSRRAVDGLYPLGLDREQVLDRLWEIANLAPEMTRGSITGQVKALSMIVAMENFIPARHAVSSEKKSAHAPTVQIYASAWRRKATTSEPQPSHGPGHQENRQEDSPASLVPQPAPGTVGAPPDPTPSQSTLADRFTASEAPPSPYVPLFASVADLRVPFSIKTPLSAPAELQILRRTPKNRILQMIDRLQ